MRRNAESIGDAVEKSEHCSDIYCLGNLFLLPAYVTEVLHILHGCLVSSFGHQLYEVQQRLLACSETGFVKLAFDDCLYALIGGSLNTQEVSVAVQSIRTTVQVRDVAGNHLFVTPREMSLRKMNRVGELNYLAQKVGPCSEAFDNPRDLASPRASTPEIISRCDFTPGLSIFDDRDLGYRLCLLRAFGAFGSLLPGLFHRQSFLKVSLLLNACLGLESL